MTRVAICCLMLLCAAFSQEAKTASTCKDLAYANRNQTDYGPLHVANIRGTAKDAQGVLIPKVCVCVFSEMGLKLIAATETDDNGNFELKGVRVGNYRLVAKYEGFSPANAKLRVERSRSRRALLVQMRPTGLDTGSFIEIK